MTPQDPCTAVILAAGFSSRMGSFKPLLPLAGGTALERCIRLFRDVGVDGRDGENGLRGWMEQRFPDGPATVPVADAGILMDMDAPDDAAGMARLQDRTLDLSIPDAEECLALHQLYDPGPSR